jgi:hypothetical protein
MAFYRNFLLPMTVLPLMGLLGKKLQTTTDSAKPFISASRLFMLAFLCVALEHVLAHRSDSIISIAPHQSIFLGPQVDRNVEDAFTLMDIVLPLGMVCAWLGVHLSFRNNEGTNNAWTCIFGGFVAGIVMSKLVDLLAASISPSLTKFSVTGAWFCYMASIGVLSFLTSWLGALICARAGPGWRLIGIKPRQVP